MRTVLSAGLALQLAGPAAAQVPLSRSGDPGVPNISGLWLGSLTGRPGVVPAPNRGPADGRPEVYWSPWPLPYTPAFQKIYDERIAAAKKGVQLGDTGAKCLPFPMPFVIVSKVYPDEIVQTPGEVTLYLFGTDPLIIWTDGRPHPAGLHPSYKGHSIGQWAGDTLLVDTVGIVGNAPLDGQRNPHSDEVHVTWSIRRVGPDRLDFDVTVDDPQAFTAPVHQTNVWMRKEPPKWDVLDDQSCFENNQTRTDTVPEPGFVKF